MTVYDVTCMWSLKQMYIAKQKQTRRYRKQDGGYQWEEGQHRHMEWEIPIIGCKAEYVQLYNMYKTYCTVCPWEYSQCFVITVNVK